jgi:hypothetical protein
MTLIPTEEELRVASYAALRAHATSNEAKALVAKLASMVEQHSIDSGTRKNRRKGTSGKLEYAAGAFFEPVEPLDAEEPNRLGISVDAQCIVHRCEGQAPYIPSVGRGIRGSRVRAAYPKEPVRNP